jgi:hypothetical protein
MAIEAEVKAVIYCYTCDSVINNGQTFAAIFTDAST